MGYDFILPPQAVRRIRAEVGRRSRVEHKAGPHHRGRLGRQDLAIVDPVTMVRQRRICSWPCCRSAGMRSWNPLDMAQNSWLRAHVRCTSGSAVPPPACDNPKTGVIAHPREGEVVLNDAYRGLASTIRPPCCRTGQEAEGQALGGGTVWHATMALAGAMRDHQFGSLDELRTAIRAWLVEYNSRPFQA